MYMSVMFTKQSLEDEVFNTQEGSVSKSILKSV